MATTTSKSSSSSKSNTSNNKTTNSQSISTPVAQGSASQQAGIVGYTSGGGAIYGNASTAPSNIASGGIMQSGGGTFGAPTNVTGYDANGYPIDASGKVVNTGNFGGGAASPGSIAQSNQAAAATPGTYDIKPGDTLSGIAQQNNTTLQELLKQNPNIKDPNKIMAGQQLSLGDQIKQGLAQTKASGAAAPGTSAEGMSTVKGSVPPPQVAPQPSTAQQTMMQDKQWNALQDAQRQQMDALAQRESTVEVYKRLTSELGLPMLNTELINMKNVIDGTESDIRKEVQAAGGFASESQVMALAASRNEGLIKQYNTLVETRSQQMDHLNNMMQFVQDDQAFQIEKAKLVAQHAKEDAEYQDKYYNNTLENFNNIVKTVGYEGAYQAYSQDPSALALIENMAGMGPGGLQRLASLPPSQEQQLDLQLKQLQIQGAKSNLQTDAMQRANIQSQINERSAVGTGGLSEKTLSKVQGSPEYKTINSILPAIQAVSEYRNAVSKYGTAEVLSAKGKGEKKATYGNAIAAWKSLAGLGALSGADFGLAENVIPEGGKAFARTSVQTTQLNTAVNNAVKQAENLTKRMSQSYPDAAPLLQQQLDDIYVTAYPDKYKVGNNGQVYEIID